MCLFVKFGNFSFNLIFVFILNSLFNIEGFYFFREEGGEVAGRREIDGY